MPYGAKRPKIAADAFIAPNAAVIGDAVIGAQSSIWFACAVRADGNFIRIGARTNIQDGTVIHVDSTSFPTIIGDDVTVGHMALIHACTLESGSFVGMAATVMDGAVVETGAMVAAGALVPPGKTVKAGQLWAGTPARFVRDCGDQENKMIESVPPEYWAMAREYLKIGIGVVKETNE